MPGPRCPALGPPPPGCRRRARLASASPRVSLEGLARVREGRALGQLSVFSRHLGSSARAATPSLLPLSCLCVTSRAQGQAACPVQSCQPSWCEAAVSDVPTRCHQRAPENQGACDQDLGSCRQSRPGAGRGTTRQQVRLCRSSVLEGLGFLKCGFKIDFYWIHLLSSLVSTVQQSESAVCTWPLFWTPFPVRVPRSPQ